MAFVDRLVEYRLGLGKTKCCHPELRAGILQAFLLQGGSKIESAEIDHAAALVLAEQTRLTGYDASYLWLAQRLNAELVTLDRQLARAAALSRPG